MSTIVFKRERKITLPCGRKIDSGMRQHKHQKIYEAFIIIQPFLQVWYFFDTFLQPAQFLIIIHLKSVSNNMLLSFPFFTNLELQTVVKLNVCHCNVCTTLDVCHNWSSYFIQYVLYATYENKQQMEKMLNNIFNFTFIN